MKGQYFSFDAIIASVIFILSLVALLSYWHSVRSFLDYQSDPLSRDAIRVSNLLFTPPSPSPSTCATMNRLGFALAWDDRRIDPAVLDCADDQSQVWLRERLDTPYGVSIKVTNLANNSVVSLGGDVPPSAVNVVNIRRVATAVNGTGGTYLARFDITMYN